MKQQEKQLQIQIVQYLSLQSQMTKKFIFWHIPNGGHRNLLEAISFKRQGVRAGVADIVIMANNKHIYLELKADKGKQSRHQKYFENDCARFNHPYFLIKKIEEVEKILKDFELI